MGGAGGGHEKGGEGERKQWKGGMTRWGGGINGRMIKRGEGEWGEGWWMKRGCGGAGEKG